MNCRANTRSMPAARSDLCPFLTDTVKKVENRTTEKISQMLVFGELLPWDAPWRRYESQWSFF
jgi:hypothetical protein